MPADAGRAVRRRGCFVVTAGRYHRKTVILPSDEHARRFYEERGKVRRDLSSRGGRAKEEPSVALALNLIKRNCPIEEIMTDTGLSREDIEHIRELA
jgi:hypothetical protein